MRLVVVRIGHNFMPQNHLLRFKLIVLWYTEVRALVLRCAELVAGSHFL
jgi:hypothetical protein